MYKILIVDDEIGVRNAIKLLGDWETLKIGTIYEASNGKAALEIIEKEKPEIILLDMEMPCMDGKQLLSILSEKYPELISIVLSGYDTFDFMRHAIKNSVLDYLLKPVNPAELNSTLTDAVHLLEKKSAGSAIPSLAELFTDLVTALYKNKPYKGYLKSIKQEIGTHKQMCLCTLQICKASPKFPAEADFMHYIRDTLQKIVKKPSMIEIIASPFHKMRYIIFFSYEISDPMPLPMKEAFHRLSAQIAASFLTNSLLSVSLPITSLNELPDLLLQGNQTIQNTNLLALGERISENAGILQRPPYSVLDLLPLFHLAIANYRFSTLSNVFKLSLKPIKESGYFSYGESQKCLHQIIDILTDLMRTQNIAEEDLQAFARTCTEELNNYYFYFEFENIALSMFDTAIEIFSLKENPTSTFQIQRVKSFIDSNYQNSDLKVSEIANHFFISREYLSKLFKKEYGCGIREYLQNVRMKQAKELLLHNDLKICDIASLVGIPDTNYFNKIFHSHYKMSPSDYKRYMEEEIST